VLGTHEADALGSEQEGAGGVALGPPMDGFNSPLAANWISRTISASTRKRGPRASKRLYWSRSYNAGETRDDCR